jgi:hypothetical protein
VSAPATQIASATMNLGNLFCTMDQVERAQPLLTDGFAMVLNHLSADDMGMSEYDEMMAKFLMKTGKYSEAERSLTSAISRIEKQKSSQHPDLIDVLTVLAELKQLTGSTEESGAIRQRIDSISASIAMS